MRVLVLVALVVGLALASPFSAPAEAISNEKCKDDPGNEGSCVICYDEHGHWYVCPDPYKE